MVSLAVLLSAFCPALGLAAEIYCRTELLGQTEHHVCTDSQVNLHTYPIRYVFGGRRSEPAEKKTESSVLPQTTEKKPPNIPSVDAGTLSALKGALDTVTGGMALPGAAGVVDAVTKILPQLPKIGQHPAR